MVTKLLPLVHRHMAHRPEIPELYVCTNCLVMSAGVVEHVDGGNYRYDPPPRCGACSEDVFLTEEQYPREYRKDDSAVQ